jgi:hypothetical protein
MRLFAPWRREHDESQGWRTPFGHLPPEQLRALADAITASGDRDEHTEAIADKLRNMAADPFGLPR